MAKPKWCVRYYDVNFGYRKVCYRGKREAQKRAKELKKDGMENVEVGRY